MFKTLVSCSPTLCLSPFWPGDLSTGEGHWDLSPILPALGWVRGDPASMFLLRRASLIPLWTIWSSFHLNFQEVTQLWMLGLIRRKQMGVPQQIALWALVTKNNSVNALHVKTILSVGIWCIRFHTVLIGLLKTDMRNEIVALCNRKVHCWLGLLFRERAAQLHIRDS